MAGIFLVSGCKWESGKVQPSAINIAKEESDGKLPYFLHALLTFYLITSSILYVDIEAFLCHVVIHYVIIIMWKSDSEVWTFSHWNVLFQAFTMLLWAYHLRNPRKRSSPNVSSVSVIVQTENTASARLEQRRVWYGVIVQPVLKVLGCRFRIWEAISLKANGWFTWPDVIHEYLIQLALCTGTGSMNTFITRSVFYLAHCYTSFACKPNKMSRVWFSLRA